eukprot:768502-Hanusia_phi.AAC.3
MPVTELTSFDDLSRCHPISRVILHFISSRVCEAFATAGRRTGSCKRGCLSLILDVCDGKQTFQSASSDFQQVVNMQYNPPAIGYEPRPQQQQQQRQHAERRDEEDEEEERRERGSEKRVRFLEQQYASIRLGHLEGEQVLVQGGAQGWRRRGRERGEGCGGRWQKEVLGSSRERKREAKRTEQESCGYMRQDRQRDKEGGKH